MWVPPLFGKIFWQCTKFSVHLTGQWDYKLSPWLDHEPRSWVVGRVTTTSCDKAAGRGCTAMSHDHGQWAEALPRVVATQSRVVVRVWVEITGHERQSWVTGCYLVTFLWINLCFHNLLLLLINFPYILSF